MGQLSKAARAVGKGVLLAYLLVSPCSTQSVSTLPYVAERFAQAYNTWVENFNRGVLDLKSCYAANKNWKSLYNHSDWPKAKD